MKNYVLKINGNYYAGPNGKYADMYNISGSGPLGAKRMTEDELHPLADYFKENGNKIEIEIYQPEKYLKHCLEDIIRYEQEWKKGKDPGYAIRNNALNALKYLEQITKK